LDFRDIKYLLILLICNFFILFGYAQNDVAKAMIEMDKRMTTYQVLKIDTEFYNTKEIHKLFYFDNDKKLRKTINYYKSGLLKSIFNRNKKSHIDGLSLAFYETGSLESYGFYNNGVGFSYDYYEDGRIKTYSQSKDTYLTGYEASFCDDESLYYETFHDSLDYMQKGYYCNHKLRIKGRLLNGKEEGKWQYWDEDGNLIKEETYDKGKLLKTKEYDEQGILIKEY